MSLCSSHYLCKAGASSCFNVKLNIYIQTCVMVGVVWGLILFLCVPFYFTCQYVLCFLT